MIATNDSNQLVMSAMLTNKHNTNKAQTQTKQKKTKTQTKQKKRNTCSIQYQQKILYE